MRMVGTGGWPTAPVAVAVLALAAAVVAVGGPVAPPNQAQASETDDELAECDRFVEAYVRSSARKLWRALAVGDYGLQQIERDDLLEVAAGDIGADDPIELEVLFEHDAQIVGLVDRTREWEQTYVVAMAEFGPIVVSQTWQPRVLRETQACEPFKSTVEHPPVIASTVEVEPFRYWGLRASWRIPSSETAAPQHEQLEDAVVDAMRRFAGVDDEEPGDHHRVVTEE